MRLNKFLTIILFVFVCSSLNGQTGTNVLIDFESDCTEFNDLQFYIEDSISIKSKLDSIRTAFYSEGYLSFSIDTIFQLDSILVHKVFLGNKYFTDSLLIDNELFFNQNDSTVFSLSSLLFYYDKILDAKERDGFPLARIIPHSFLIQDSNININSVTDTIGKIYFDTIEILGQTKISYNFISDYLNIHKGDLYSKTKLFDIKYKLDQLDYIGLRKEPLLVFFGNRAKIILQLEQKKNNVFDFIIGVLPQAETGKWLITGDVTLLLANKIGFGEQLFFKFKKYKSESQELNFDFSLPYLKYVPFGLKSKINIIKDESKYLSINGGLGLFYQNQNIKYYSDWDYNESRLLSIDTSDILNKQTLPKTLDYVYNGGRIGVLKIELDHKTNPRRGFFADMNFGLGIKTTIVNNKIVSLKTEDINFLTSYDSLDLSQIQLDFNILYSKFFPVFSKSTINFKTEFHSKFTNQNLLDNELYKIGGFAQLRGFDEESILVATYGLSTIEYRLLLSQNSYLSLPFIDVAYTKSNWENNQWDFYYGIGGGMNIETKAGLFNFAIAVGKGPNTSFDIQKPKVHFGYLSIF